MRPSPNAKGSALANKEALRSQRPLCHEEAVRAPGASSLPVDSEHTERTNASGPVRVNEVMRLILTASGGPSATHRKRPYGT